MNVSFTKQTSLAVSGKYSARVCFAPGCFPISRLILGLSGRNGLNVLGDGFVDAVIELGARRLDVTSDGRERVHGVLDEAIVHIGLSRFDAVSVGVVQGMRMWWCVVVRCGCSCKWN